MVRNGPVASRGRSRWWPFGGKSNRRRGLTPAATAAVPRATVGPEPTRRAPPRRSWRDRLRLVGLVATVGALGTAIWGGHRWLTRSAHFAIRELRLPTLRHANAEDLRARTNVNQGDNLFALDLHAVERELAGDPWVKRAHVYRELPATLVLDVEEREPACLVALGPLYLADARGEIFKRAAVDEGAGLPIVTGVARDLYVDDRETSQALVREALAAIALFSDGKRPTLGEAHIDAAMGVTLYTVEGVGVRLGRGDEPTLRSRLARLDLAWRALDSSSEKPRLFIVDQQAHPERVIVRLASR